MAAKVLVHLLCNGHYGYFRDEYYYIACSDRLDWGYVDHPPFSIAVLKVVRLFLGDSLFAIRLLPVLAGAAVVCLSALIARSLGGKRYAQGLAALTVIISPVFLAISNFYSMNSFDMLFWAAAMYVVVLLIKHDEPRLWIVFGAISGIALQNKISIGFLGLGVVVGLLLTRQRRQFKSPYFWLSGLLAFLLFLPHILWQIRNDYPTLEFMHNATAYKNLLRSPQQFLIDVALITHPFNLPFWLLGLWFLFFHRVGKQYRLMGWAFVTVFLLLLAKNGKAYYLAPAFPVLLAAGSVQLERLLERPTLSWLRYAVLLVLIAGGVLIAPMALPIVPIQHYVAYEESIGIRPPQEERGASPEIPQHHADRFGWESMTEIVADACKTLTPDELSECIIFTDNYGQAGAIEFHGRNGNLPPVVSGHNNYFLWGDGDRRGEAVIAVDVDIEDLEELFESVQLFATHTHPYAREKAVPICICRTPNVPLPEIWPDLKKFI